MKLYPILTFSLLLFVLFSCSSEMTTQEAAIDNPVTEHERTAPSVEAVISKEEEGTAVRASSTDEEMNEVSHKEEIRLIHMEIAKISKNIINYTQQKSTVDWETETCQLTQYVNKDGVVVKREADCGDHYWETYSIALSKTSAKILYGQYLETVPDARLPKVREFYSIGSMIPSKDAYTVIMDESGKEVGPEGYRKYSVLYDKAVLAFSLLR